VNIIARSRFVSLLVLGLSLPLVAQTSKKVLFDHTHHEEGGVSAEWVICSGHEPDPVPANPTKETDWNGGISAMGYDLYTRGYIVQTLPATGGRITFGDATNAQDLSKYGVFFIPECYTYFTAAEKTAIVKFVQGGGGLFLMGNHQGASRVTSSVPGSTDAYTVFNDLMTNNGVANNGFGFTWIIGHGPGDAAANTTSTAYSSAVNPVTNAIIRGTNGTLAMQDFHSFSYLSINTANNPSAQGILSTQVAGDPSSDYFIATSTLGAGRVVAMGDSSPADDGTTTTSGKTLHNSYTVNSNRAFFMNAIQYLAGTATAQPPVVSISAPVTNVSTTVGNTVTFQGAATDPAGSAMTYGWAFGDATSSTGLGPIGHVYMTAGTYTAKFTATNAQSLSSSATRIITVTVPTGNTVTANLTTPAANVTVASGTAVAFAGSGSDSSPTATLSYAWNFGDGATASGPSISHVYTNTGTTAVAYTATFTVTDSTGVSASAIRSITVNPVSSTGSSFTEGFNTGTKGAYTTGNVTFASGAWTLNDALLGNSASDPKTGTQSVRMRNSGKLTMLYNWATGAKTVSVKHAVFAGDAASTWSLWYSTNSGSTWTQTGSAVTTSAATLSAVSFTLNIAGPIRFEIRKTDGTTRRVNFDDFQVSGY
jgi:chitodextrinase